MGGAGASAPRWGGRFFGEKRRFDELGKKTRIKALTPRQVAKAAGSLALSKKAEDVLVLDLRKISTVSDYFVVCSGTSDVQVKAIADAVVSGLEEKGVIAWHTVAMFAPGFFTGNLIRRFGEVKMIMSGLFLEAACIVVALSGIEVLNFWVAMFLLGLGWNFTFTAATTLMTTAYTPAERAKTQGMMNQIIYTIVAIGSLSSGAFIHFFGWNWVNIGAVPLLLVSAAVTLWYAAGVRKAAAV